MVIWKLDFLCTSEKEWTGNEVLGGHRVEFGLSFGIEGSGWMEGRWPVELPWPHRPFQPSRWDWIAIITVTSRFMFILWDWLPDCREWVRPQPLYTVSRKLQLCHTVKAAEALTRCSHHGLPSLQNHKLNKLLLLIIFQPVVLCYSSRKSTKTGPYQGLWKWEI